MERYGTAFGIHPTAQAALDRLGVGEKWPGVRLLPGDPAEVKRRVIDGGLLSTDDPRDGLRRFLHATLAELSANPLWRRLMTHPEEMQAVARKLDPARVTAMSDNPVTALTEFVADRSGRGELVHAHPAVIIGVLQCVLLVPMFADRLGDPDLYRKTLDLLVDIVASGLTQQK
ncbi:hypothetical protein ACFY05_39670 [Microtetraspora fusca]|uniref:Tetracyclin repressor-like C-terminal domain-containing protein n=1 Tax=Microtetraspora fusca TaxID=1997 RepID=A0ABW6VIB8_MICFU